MVISALSVLLGPTLTSSIDVKSNHRIVSLNGIRSQLNTSSHSNRIKDYSRDQTIGSIEPYIVSNITQNIRLVDWREWKLIQEQDGNSKRLEDHLHSPMLIVDTDEIEKGRDIRRSPSFIPAEAEDEEFLPLKDFEHMKHSENSSVTNHFSTAESVGTSTPTMISNDSKFISAQNLDARTTAIPLLMVSMLPIGQDDVVSTPPLPPLPNLMKLFKEIVMLPKIFNSMKTDSGICLKMLNGFN